MSTISAAAPIARKPLYTSLFVQVLVALLLGIVLGMAVPDFATLFILVRNPGELLPTIRSRCVIFSLSALPNSEIERYLERSRPEWNARQRQLVARLSGGAVARW